MILTMELIPISSWGKNLRNKLTPYYWQQISQEMQSNVQYTCEICGRTKSDILTRLNCHEVWEFDFIDNIQKLIGLQVLCFECHSGKHLGFSNLHKDIDEASIKKHFLKINKISEKEYVEYLNNQLDIYKKASNLKWTIDYGYWDYLVEDKETSKDFANEQITHIYNYIKQHENVLIDEIYEDLYSTRKILKTTFKKYLREASEVLRQEQTSEHVRQIYNYLKSHRKATNKELYSELFSKSTIIKSDFEKFTRAERKRLKQEHIKKIFGD